MTVPLFFALYYVEVGLFLTVIPWTRIWTLNPFLHSHVAMGLWADNPFVRGFVSGIGVMHILIGVRDIFVISRDRRGGVTG